MAHDKTAILYLSERGRDLSNKIKVGLKDSFVIDDNEKVGVTIEKIWSEYDRFIFVMSIGIVIRSINGLINNKKTDPCVVVVDEAGMFAVSLLSGHIGGGNALSEEVSKVINSTAVITTASDRVGHTSLDLWALTNKLLVEDDTILTKTSAKLLKKGFLNLFIDLPYHGKIPKDIKVCHEVQDADVYVGYREHTKISDECLILRPRILSVGIGCNRNTPHAEISESMCELFKSKGISQNCCEIVCSSDVKIDENGILQFARKNGLSLKFYSKNQLNSVEGVSASAAAMKAIGVKGVAEPAAILSATIPDKTGELIIEKNKWKNVTIAVARRQLTLKE